MSKQWLNWGQPCDREKMFMFLVGLSVLSEYRRKMMEGSFMPLTFDALLFLRISFAYFTQGGEGSDKFIHCAVY